ncbi:hypothetical protein P7K49_024614 [Saguinus oedipus]|uniref:Uncharacterized protein n=1 Tax=Saguinus oedipus TaxID=9490 RepID=A0ABQ9UQ24_SAGOE|nr:hypothetical protein P7K49_024614 [Saguinus oedipus]
MVALGTELHADMVAQGQESGNTEAQGEGSCASGSLLKTIRCQGDKAEGQGWDGSSCQPHTCWAHKDHWQPQCHVPVIHIHRCQPLATFSVNASDTGKQGYEKVCLSWEEGPGWVPRPSSLQHPQTTPESPEGGLGAR